MIKDKQKKGVVEIISHCYFQIFMMPLTRLNSFERYKEQLSLELHKA